MNERMTAHLGIIKAVVNTLDAAGISAWLFGGWGLDARIGRITREHGDVEFWVERVHAERSKALLTAAGALLGVGAGAFGARALAHTLYGVTANEPLIYAVAALVLSAAALVATYGPARRASAIDPMIALRAE